MLICGHAHTGLGDSNSDNSAVGYWGTFHHMTREYSATKHFKITSTNKNGVISPLPLKWTLTDFMNGILQPTT